MTKEEFLVLANAMKAVYERNNFLANKDGLKIWYEMLKDIPYSAANIAIQKYMMTNKFPPTIADIREGAAQVAMPEIPTSGEAWQKAIMAVRKYGYYQQQEALANLDSLTREAVMRFGFRELCDMNASDIGIARGQFMKIYDQLANRKKTDAVLPIGMHREIARLREQTLLKIDEKVGD